MKQGDCNIVQHGSGHVTVIDVFNASPPADRTTAALQNLIRRLGLPEVSRGDFNQKAHPVNPIEYLQTHGINQVFRFILTHPDMDHMGGMRAFFETFNPINFWDTDNNEQKEFEADSPYDENDWRFYKALRDGKPGNDPKRLTVYSGGKGKYWNEDDDGKGGDYLHVLAPTRALVAAANESGDYNDCSYVLLYRAAGGKVLFCGDSHDRTWEHILKHHADAVRNVDLLLAPHHGRRSGRSYDFLDVVNPTLTFFGNASAEHLAYDAWTHRKLAYITNNQANCMVVDVGVKPMQLYVTNKAFAEKVNPGTYLSDRFKAYYCCPIER